MTPEPDRGAVNVVAAAACGLLLVPILAAAAFLGSDSESACVPGMAGQPPPAGQAGAVPANYLALYRKSGGEAGIGWHVLAAIGKIESGHGANMGPSSAGALGPMQFMPATWLQYRVDGNGDGRRDIRDPADAIPAAARYLKASGAPGNIRSALWHYNHSWDYVRTVLAQAERYAKGPVASGPDVPQCATGAGVAPSGITGRLVKFVLAQVGKRYVYGGNGPDVWDCSGLLQGAYRQVGVSIPRITWDQFTFGPRIPRGQEQPGDLIFFYGSSDDGGPGKPGHAGMVVGGGKHVNARCTRCQPGVQLNDYTSRKRIAGIVRPLEHPRVRAQLAGRHPEASPPSDISARSKVYPGMRSSGRTSTVNISGSSNTGSPFGRLV